jgi:hypothetical protein
MRQSWILHGVPMLDGGQQQIFTACQSFQYLNALGADPPLVQHCLALLGQDLPAIQNPTIIADAPGLAKADLIPFWHVMARTPKQHGMAAMKDALLAYSQGPHGFNFASPVVSGLEIISLRFCGDTADIFSVGISPFAVSDGSNAHCTTNLQIAETQCTPGRQHQHLIP